MVHVFTTNKNGKIELTKDEIKKLLDEAYWDGYRANSGTYTYTTPSWRTPYTWSINGATLNCSTDTGFETAKANTNTITSAYNIKKE